MTGVSESRRALAQGLLVAAGVVALLMLAWILSSGVNAGGAVLGLLLLLVLAGPLAGAGYYLLVRGRGEELEERAFIGKRRVLDADRLFRRELIARLRQLAKTPGVPAQKLGQLADGMAASAQDEAAWYGAVQLDDSQIAMLSRYDDLVWERVGWLADHPDVDAAAVASAVEGLRQAIDQRTNLLVRGRVAPAVAPAALLRAPTEAAAEAEMLAVGDAVTRDGLDYLVKALAVSFSDGQTWKLLHMVPSGAESEDHWLFVSPGGLELAWLDEISVGKPGAAQVTFGTVVLRLIGSGSALAQVQTSTGTSPGVLVTTWMYRANSSIELVEQWPDGTVRGYAGHIIQPRELEIWPASSQRNGNLPLTSGNAAGAGTR